MKINQVKVGALLSYIQMAVNIIIGIAYTPIMLRILGQSEYGLYSTVSSTISMLGILSLGFNSSYIRYYSRYKAKNDEDGISRLNGLFLLIFLIIGTIAFLCGTYLTTHLELVFDSGLNAEEYDVAKKLIFLLTINLSITFPMSVFQNIIAANERYIFLKLLGICKHVLGPIVTLPVLLMGYGSIGMVSVTLFISLVTDISYLTYAKKILGTRIKFKNFEKGLFSDMFKYTFFIALNIVVNQINNELGKFLLGRYRGTVAVAIYSVGASIYLYYSMFSTAISGVFAPRIHRIINKYNNRDEQKKHVTSLFTKVGRIQFIILFLISSGFVFFGKTFVLFWAGAGYDEAYYIAILLIFSATVALIQNIGIEIQRAMNKHRFRGLAYTIMAMINIVATMLLSEKYGAVGAAIGTSCSYVLMNGITMNIYYHKQCNIDIVYFWREIIKLSRGAILPVIVGIIIINFIEVSSALDMLFGILGYSAIYLVSMWFTGMNEYEKNLVKKPLRRLKYVEHS